MLCLRPLVQHGRLLSVLHVLLSLQSEEVEEVEAGSSKA